MVFVSLSHLFAELLVVGQHGTVMFSKCRSDQTWDAISGAP
jgi:hypothetical protein